MFRTVTTVTRPTKRVALALGCAAVLGLGLASTAPASAAPAVIPALSSVIPAPAAPAAIPALGSVIPAPAEVRPVAGADFRLGTLTVIRTQPGSAAARAVGNQLAQALRPATGYRLPVLPAAPRGLPTISLLLGAGDARLVPARRLPPCDGAPSRRNRDPQRLHSRRRRRPGPG